MAARDKKQVQDDEDLVNVPQDVEPSDDDDDDGSSVTEPSLPQVEEETEEENKQFWSDDKMPSTTTVEEVEAETEAEPETTKEETQDLDKSDEVETNQSSVTQEDEPETFHQAGNMHDDAPPVELHGITESSSGGGNKLKIGAAVVVGLAVLAGGFMFYQSRSESDTSEVAGDSTEILDSTPMPTPQPVEKVEVDFSEFSIQILNGSGTPGEAGKVQELLSEEGFEEFKTGNAKSYTYKETEVSVKSGTPDEVVDHVKETLGENYSVTDGDELDSDSEFDVVVIVGSKEAE